MYVFDARVELNQKTIRSFRFQTHHQKNGNELGFGEEPVDYDSHLSHLWMVFAFEEHAPG